MRLRAPCKMNDPATFQEGVGESTVTGTATHPFLEGSTSTTLN